MSKYRIVSVRSKRERENKWHRVVTGKLCVIESLEWGEMAWLRIWGISPWEETTRFHTSSVLKTTEKDGVLTIDTVNSVYTLEMVNEQ